MGELTDWRFLRATMRAAEQLSRDAGLETAQKRWSDSIAAISRLEAEHARVLEENKLLRADSERLQKALEEIERCSQERRVLALARAALLGQP